MRRGVLLAGWLALAAAAPAAAQDPAPQPPAQPAASASDPIGDLLAQQAAALPDPEETGREAEPPRRGRTARPVAAPGLSGEAYDSRIRASMAAAQGYQGPLDGGWTLRATDGALYALQLVDRGDGRPVEGAWRDLKHPGSPEGSGFLDAVERAGAEVTLRFGPRVAVLHAGGDGRFAGELSEGDMRRPVTLTRAP